MLATCTTLIAALARLDLAYLHLVESPDRDLPARLAAGGPCNTPDTATFYGGDHRGYPVLAHDLKALRCRALHTGGPCTMPAADNELPFPKGLVTENNHGRCMT